MPSGTQPPTSAPYAMRLTPLIRGPNMSQPTRRVSRLKKATLGWWRPNKKPASDTSKRWRSTEAAYVSSVPLSLDQPFGQRDRPSKSRPCTCSPHSLGLSPKPSLTPRGTGRNSHQQHRDAPPCYHCKSGHGNRFLDRPWVSSSTVKPSSSP